MTVLYPKEFLPDEFSKVCCKQQQKVSQKIHDKQVTQFLLTESVR